MGISKTGFILLAFLFLQGVVLCMARGQVHYYDFVLKETTITRLCSTKSILTVNGSFPGPAITVTKGDTLYVNVRNEGLYGVTIHWHGVKQPRNPWSDGPENVTQCPIAPGTNFIQKIIFSDEEGTLWWHAHSDWSRATVHGPIIILPEERTTYPFPKPYAEQTIVLGEWYKGDVMEIIKEALATGGDPNRSDAYTINGQPGDLYSCSKESMYRLSVRFGKTYLLRIVNAVMNEEQFFGIANHKLTVVSQDAAYIKPITTDFIVITPGQTMDVLLTASQVPSLYYIVTTPYADTIVPFDNTTATAVLQYKGKYIAPESIPFPSLPTYNDRVAADSFTNRIRALASHRYRIRVPLKINKRIYMTVSINQNPCANNSCAGPFGNRVLASLNNVSFVMPFISILQAYYKGINGVFGSDFPNVPPYFFNFTGDVGNNTLSTSLGTKVKMVNYGEALEIVFQGTNVGAAENHPMHLHGFSFYLVGSGYGNFDKKTDPRTYNLIDPPQVNTIGVPKNGWATIRFIADNPGVWFMHCHLERHASWGMDTVIIVKNGPTRETSMLPPPFYMPPCS